MRLQRLAAPVALAAALAFTACGEEPTKPTIRIGTILSITGEMSNTGQEDVDAANLAVEQINAAGGVLGKELELLHRDDATDPDRAMVVAQQLVGEGVVAVVGAIGSSSTLAAASKLVPAGIVQLSPSSTSPAITSLADDDLVFRTCPPDTLQGRLLAQRAHSAGKSKVAVIHLPDTYGAGLADAFEARFTALGGTVTRKLAYTEAQESYTALVNEVASDDPDAVLLVGYPVDSAKIIDQYLLSGNGSAFWYFGDALQDMGFIDALGPQNFTFPHEGTGPGTPSGEHFEAYRQAFHARYGKNPTPGTYGENVYDAIYLLALALEKAGNEDGGAGLADALRAVSAGGTSFTPAGFAEAKAALARGEDIDLRGASGPVDFDAAGDVVGTYNIWDVQQGAFHIKESGLTPSL